MVTHNIVMEDFKLLYTQQQMLYTESSEQLDNLEEILLHSIVCESLTFN